MSRMLISLFALCSPLMAQDKPAATAGITKAPAAVVINDSWYTMQAGSAPWGYFHELIERRGERYFYRYDMTRFERGAVYRENIGAAAEGDLTPIAFNLNRSGKAATESVNASYSPAKRGGVMKIEISGAKQAVFTRRLPAGTILDVFVPVYFARNWDKLKPRAKGWLSTFAEDNANGEFQAKKVQYEAGETDPTKGCLNLVILIDSTKASWCMTKQGVLREIRIGDVRVDWVKGEVEAKKFLGGVMPKEGN